MQEISPQVFIETGYPGVTLGAINLAHGLVLIDSPLRMEDARSWRSALLNHGGGVDRMVVNLDAHIDRTAGIRAMDCMVVGHERLLHIFRNRPTSSKSQSIETGSEFELLEGLGSIRWQQPEITFSEQMNIYWDEKPLLLQSKPGSSGGAIWAILPDEGVIFVGDAVVLNQPPFLATGDIPIWIETLQGLLQKDYRNFSIISSRGGLVPQEEVRNQINLLKKIQEKLTDIASHKGTPDQVAKVAVDLVRSRNYPQVREKLYRNRIVWGMTQYYIRHFHSQTSPADE